MVKDIFKKKVSFDTYSTANFADFTDFEKLQDFFQKTHLIFQKNLKFCTYLRNLTILVAFICNNLAIKNSNSGHSGIFNWQVYVEKNRVEWMIFLPYLNMGGK